MNENVQFDQLKGYDAPQSEHADMPKKYRVFKALSDLFSAASHNAATYFLSLILSSLVAGGLFVVVSLLIDTLFFGEFGLLGASLAKLMSLLFVSLVSYTLWYSFSGALIVATTSLALAAGADHMKNSVGLVFSIALSRIRRIMLANLFFSLVVFWPLGIIVFLPFIFFYGTLSGGNSIALLLYPFVFLIALIWIYIALVRYSLAPIVALYEPHVPITKTLARSQHLLTKGGQWFLIKGFMLVIFIIALVGGVTGQNLDELRESDNLAINGIFIVLSVIINGVLFMLYRNRVAVRGSTQTIGQRNNGQSYSG